LMNNFDTAMDLTLSDSLSIWIKVQQAPTHPEYMVFRIELKDQPTPEDAVEWYMYENATVLDVAGDWVMLKVPLAERETDGTVVPNEEGFVLFPTTWGGGQYNNSTLDRDAIVGFDLQLVTSGWTDPDNVPEDSLIVSFDMFELFGLRKTPFIFFNGMALNPAWITWSWGQSTYGVEEGAGVIEGTNALKWVQGNEWGNGWSGVGMTMVPVLNMGAVYETDTLYFKLKADPGTGTMRVYFQDSAANPKGTTFDPLADGTWHDFAFPLADMITYDGKPETDWTDIKDFAFLAEGNAIAGKVVYITDIWTDHPVFDVIPPAAPQNLFVAPG